jgi:signal transduction histidine kinase
MHASVDVPAPAFQPGDTAASASVTAARAALAGRLYTPQSTVADLPGASIVLDVNSLGEQIAQVFQTDSNVPGIILSRGGHFSGLISNTQFFRMLSIPFGREIFTGRPIARMIERVQSEPMILPGSMFLQSAVEAVLSRDRENLYEPFVVHDEGRELLQVCSVQDLMLASNQVSALRNDQMEQILTSVTDGLLMIDRNFVINNEYSKIVEKILDRTNLGGQKFSDVLGTMVDATTLKNAIEYFQVLFNPKLIDRLIKGVNPIKEISVRIAQPDGTEATKYFAINFERVRTKDGIRQVLVRIEDVTRRVMLAQELEKQQTAAKDRLKILTQLLAQEPAAVHSFLTAYENHLGACKDMLANGTDPAEALREMFRKAHKLKGEAALLRLSAYEEGLHAFEDKLQKRQSDSKPTLAGLDQDVAELLDLASEARGTLEHLARWRGSGAAEPETIATRSSRIPARLRTLAAEVCQRHSKKAALHILPEKPDFSDSLADLIEGILVQLVRNSIMHGIELPGVREAAGKHPEGVIQVAIEKDEETVEIIFQDDGGGLDLDRIRQRAAAIGLPVATDEDVKRAIFAPGFSTAAHLSHDAGRGVGLDIVHDTVKSRGGQILVHTEGGQYCAFQILIPLASAFPVSASA